MKIPLSGTEQRFRFELVALLKSPSPAQVVWQVAGCHAIEACNPLLKPTVIGIDFLHVVSAIDALVLAEVKTLWRIPSASQDAA